MVDQEALISDLHALGFTHHESRCFIALMESHPATAYDVAKRAGVPRANAYSALDNLLRKEAVQPVSENPVRFAPVDPETLFRRIAEGTADRCASVARSLGRIKQPEELTYVWSIPNLTKVHAKIEELIDNASQRIWIKGNKSAVEVHVDALKRASDRGVEVVIILFGTDADVRKYTFNTSTRVFLHENRGTHVGHSNHLFCIGADNTEGLTASLREEGYGIHTRNPPVVELINSLIRHEIYMAEIFHYFGNEIEDKFGDMLMTLREKYLPRHFVEDLKSRLDESDPEIPSRTARK
ncbi:MAG: helix-turn-helix domain-containing protein [Rhodospirillales bacterium]